MTDYAHIEESLAGSVVPWGRGGRLVDDDGLVSVLIRDIVQCPRLENCEPRCHLNRLETMVAPLAIPVNICSRERNNHRCFRTVVSVFLNGGITLVCVEDHNKIIPLSVEILGDSHTVTKPSQDPSPPKGCDAVTLSGARRNRGDNTDS